MKKEMPSWLESAIFYQIYPQSYYDTNGDGIGDIKGIHEKLDYIQQLGVNAIWINPCFESPFKDAGYDVSNYYKVAPRYGTNADLEELMADCNTRGIRVILDLVPGHTSMDHAWFQESQKAERNQYTDWYIWNDSVWADQEPGLNITRGYAERNASYIANFFYFQPALNYGFAHPDPDKPWQQPVSAPGPQAVIQEIKHIIAFWLERGASGFRVDMASSLVKRDPGKIETGKIWLDIRAWMSEHYPKAVLIAEWGVPAQALQSGFHVDMLLGGYHNPGLTSLFRKRGIGMHRDPYGWSFFDEAGHGDITQFVDEYTQQLEQTQALGYMGIITGNHDEHPRIADGKSMEMMKLVYLFLLTMPGTPFIYYGDEIGMTYVHGLASKEGGYERTGVRTPMQWQDSLNAGFSTGSPEKLYLPVSESYPAVNVANQLADPSSLFNTVQHLISIRKSHPALQAESAFSVVHAQAGELPFVYQRTRADETYLVALNPSRNEVHYTFKLEHNPKEISSLFAQNGAFRLVDNQMTLDLGPVSGLLVKLSS